jgi:hypothetical protein
MPLTSISNVTSICGTPFGAGGMLVSSNLARLLLYAAMSLSPCRTCTSTRVWLSATVVKIRLLRVGIVLFLSMSGVKVPSLVSMPSVCGVTSRRTGP